MKRLQVMVPDEMYDSLQKEAKRREWTVADLVRRGIERQLASAVDVPWRKPTITPVDMGQFLMPMEDWRLAANERPAND